MCKLSIWILASCLSAKSLSYETLSSRLPGSVIWCRHCPPVPFCLFVSPLSSSILHKCSCKLSDVMLSFSKIVGRYTKPSNFLSLSSVCKIFTLSSMLRDCLPIAKLSGLMLLGAGITHNADSLTTGWLPSISHRQGATDLRKGDVNG